MRVLLLTPPLTQLNTPYPATAYLKGFLKGERPDVEVIQRDFSLELVLALFSVKFLSRVFEGLQKGELSFRENPAEVNHYLENKTKYLTTIEPVVRFLQGKDPTLAYRIVGRDYLPEGYHFSSLRISETEETNWAFGSLGIQDFAKHLASLFLDDVSRLIEKAVDPHFAFSKYGEKLAASQASFDPLYEALQKSSLVTECLEAITEKALQEIKPDLVAVTAPFPGNVLGAFQIARVIKKKSGVKGVALGGGYVNTELRKLKDPRVFGFFDILCMDDGEIPLLKWIELHEGKGTSENLIRSHIHSEDTQSILYKNTSTGERRNAANLHPPSYSGLRLEEYPQLLEVLNPMHRLWSDGRWNKLTLAHGCYWKRCSFCDTSLDYIERYDPKAAEVAVDQMVAIARETGVTGFHFVDEAAPPALLKAVSKEILKRNLSFTWWGNIRFDKTFNEELVTLMRQAGCVAVTGGLEVASDRLLKKMQKGVTVEQVARVSRTFSEQGILVHAYLMYGFPTQTVLETVDCLERVRQLFLNGCIQSAFWHRFSATVHSPVGRNPEAFGIKLLQREEVLFAENDIPFEEADPIDHEALGRGLKKALYNYLRGTGLEMDVREWFDFSVPKTKVAKSFIRDALK